MTGALNKARTLAAGVTLTDGRVLIVGGEGRRDLVATAELWDPLSGTFSLAGELEEARLRADAIAQLRCSAPGAPSDQWLPLARTVGILAAAE